MFCGVEVFCGVLVLGGIAATDVAANEAEPEMHPGVMHLEALLAAFRFGFDGADLIEMGTLVGHDYP
jgi:hypothetical protein